jgi:hypothetical protein
VTPSTAAAIPDASISLSSMLKRALVDANDEPIGRFEDAIIKLRNDQYPLVVGLVIDAGGNRVFVPASGIVALQANRIRLSIARKELRPFERHDDAILLKQDVLGHRLIDIERRALVKAYDVRIAATPEGWVATGLDVHRTRWFHFGAHEHHPARDWHAFLLLIGDQKILESLSASSRIGRLKPAQIADIIERASAHEQDLLLAQVHADPDLEADVFEELDEERQAQLFKTRSDQEIADVLSRMRSDDVADVVMDLPQERRRKVLDLLPPAQNTKVLTLLGYNEATAGGLMGTDYLALPEEHSVADALQQLRAASTTQPEALTTIHSLHSDGSLAGTLGLVRALQLDPTMLLRDAADPDTIVASPEDDIIAVTTRMADFNLLTLPVVDSAGRLLGVVTVDDALEAAIPRDWFKRESGQATPQPRRPITPKHGPSAV